MSLAVLATLLLAGAPAGAYQAAVPPTPMAASAPTAATGISAAPPSPDRISPPTSTATSTPTTTPTGTPTTTSSSTPLVLIVPVPAQLPVPSPPPPATGAALSGPRAAAQQKLRLGDQLLAEGDARMALFAYQDAVNQDPHSAEARLKLGRVYLLLDHPEEAAEQFGVAAALEPGMAEAREALEQARSRHGRYVPAPGSPVVARVPGGEPDPGYEVPPAAPTAVQ